MRTSEREYGSLEIVLLPPETPLIDSENQEKLPYLPTRWDAVLYGLTASTMRRRQLARCGYI